MNERSVLRLREKPHIHPDRQNEIIVEVFRDGLVVATIYGTREGVQVVSGALSHVRNQPFGFLVGPQPSIIIPLLKPNESCPWCADAGFIGDGISCPVCRSSQ
jgi:hypothetical protein